MLPSSELSTVFRCVIILDQSQQQCFEFIYIRLADGNNSGELRCRVSPHALSVPSVEKSSGPRHVLLANTLIASSVYLSVPLSCPAGPIHPAELPCEVSLEHEIGPRLRTIEHMSSRNEAIAGGLRLRSEVNNSLIIVNFFHKIQNFRQISDLFSQI